MFALTVESLLECSIDRFKNFMGYRKSDFHLITKNYQFLGKKICGRNSKIDKFPVTQT